jgi:hypothetical protein
MPNKSKKYFITSNTSGPVFARSSDSRTYTHCVIVRYATDSEPGSRWPHKAGDVCLTTWAGRPDLARNQVSANSGRGRTAEAIEVIEVDRKAYDAARKS